jgi:hypothetical protein
MAGEQKFAPRSTTNITSPNTKNPNIQTPTVNQGVEQIAKHVDSSAIMIDEDDDKEDSAPPSKKRVRTTDANENSNEQHEVNETPKTASSTVPNDDRHISSGKPSERRVDAPQVKHDANQIRIELPPASFNMIRSSKLAQVGIDPNDKTSVFVNISLFEGHPLQIHRMPAGKWTKDDLIALLEHDLTGCAIKAPSVPRGLYTDTSTSTDQQLKQDLSSIISNCKRFGVTEDTNWTTETNRTSYLEAKKLHDEIKTSFSAGGLSNKWSELLIDGSRVLSVSNINNMSSAKLLLKCENNFVAIIVALHLQAWSAIPHQDPKLRQDTHDVLHDYRVDKGWSKVVPKSNDRKRSQRSSVFNFMLHQKLREIDIKPEAKKHDWLTNRPSTACSVANAIISYVRKPFVSCKLTNLPWQPHGSCEALMRTTEWVQWTNEHFDFEHKMFPIDSRPEPSIAIWIPREKQEILPRIVTTLSDKCPNIMLETSLAQQTSNNKIKSNRFTINVESAAKIASAYNASPASIPNTSSTSSPKSLADIVRSYASHNLADSVGSKRKQPDSDRTTLNMSQKKLHKSNDEPTAAQLILERENLKSKMADLDKKIEMLIGNAKSSEKSASKSKRRRERAKQANTNEPKNQPLSSNKQPARSSPATAPNDNTNTDHSVNPSTLTQHPANFPNWDAKTWEIIGSLPDVVASVLSKIDALIAFASSNKYAVEDRSGSQSRL